jgi:tetratricopeptide (TPR) repeat protein
MTTPSFWSRVREGRLYQVFVVYLGVSWVVLQAVDVLGGTLGLPNWIGLAAFFLLVIGLFVVLATAWVQSRVSRPATTSVAGSPAPALAEPEKSVERKREPFLTWPRVAMGGALAFLLLFGFAGMYVVIKDRGASFTTDKESAADEAHVIAVLPFTVRGAALADMREGLVDLLSTGLDGSASLRSISGRTVLARWSESVPQSALADEKAALDIARKTGARYALTGSAVAAGNSMRVAANVYDLSGNTRLGQAQVEGSPDSVLVLVDRLALQVLGLILRKDTGDLPQINLASITTASLPALKAYLEGEMLFRRSDFKAAEKAYERAVQQDSTFALAYYRLATVHGWENTENPRGPEASARAIALVDRLPEREGMYIRALNAILNQQGSAIQLVENAVKKYPDDAEAWYLLADAHLHTPASLASWEEVEAALERAIQLAPRVTPYRIHHVDAALRFRADSALVRERLDGLEQLAGGKSYATVYRTSASLAFGDSVRRARAFADVEGMDVMSKVLIASTLLNARFADAALELLDQASAKGTADERMLAHSLISSVYMFNRGQARKAYAVIADPVVPVDSKWDGFYWARLVGMPMAQEKLDSLMAITESSKARPSVALVMGAHAAERAQWNTHAAALARLRVLTDSLRSAGDSISARATLGFSRALEGIGAWQRGRRDQAIRLLEQALPDAPTGYLRWWLGLVHQEAKHPREALTYYRTYHKFDRWAAVSYLIAQTYEQSGEPEKARTHYEFFVANWANADPELLPRVEDAKEAIARLGRDTRR